MTFLLLTACWSGRHVETSLVERELGRETVREHDGIELAAHIGDRVTVVGRAHDSDVVRASVEIEEWQERTAKIVIGRRRRLVGSQVEVRELARTPAIGEPAPWTGHLGIRAAEQSTAWQAESQLIVVDGRPDNPGDLPFVPLQHATATVALDAGLPLIATDERALYRAIVGLALADAAIGQDTPLRTTWAWWYTPRRVRIALDTLVLPAVTADPFTSREPEPFVRLAIEGQVLGCTAVIGQDVPAGTYDLGVSAIADVRQADRVVVDVLDADLKSHDLLASWTGLGRPASGWVIATVTPSEEALRGLGSCRKGLDRVVDAVGFAVDVVQGATAFARCLERDLGRSPLGTVVFHLNPEAGDAIEPIAHWLDAQAWLVGLIPDTEENAAAKRILEVANPNSNLLSAGLCLFDTFATGAD